jgi:uncharacterized protein (TIGR03663 family)
MSQQPAEDDDLSTTRATISVLLFVGAVITALFFRFYLISLKPLHHDEGVNSYFLLNLAHRGEYAYKPDNYHGPTLYYFAVLALKLFGETDLAIRFWPAILGAATVAMVWWFRRELGWIGTPAAAWLLALSPGLVYFSRDFIHEMLFGCFTLGMVAGGWRYLQTQKFKWLSLLAISAGLLFATKETAFVTVVVLLLAVFSAAFWDTILRLASQGNLRPASIVGALKRDAGAFALSRDHALSALMIFIFVNVLFYTSFFTHFRGIFDAISAVGQWTSRGVTEHVHDKVFSYYLAVLLKLELPLLLCSIVGVIFAIWRGSRIARFFAAWTIGITLAYSLIPYKTPWLVISLLVPMALVGGYAFQECWTLWRHPAMAVPVILLLIAASAAAWRMSWIVNFEAYADNSNAAGYLTRLGKRLGLEAYKNGLYGYVYAQSDPDLLNLADAIERATEHFPTRNRTPILLATQDYWPLPWYLRGDEQVSYSAALPDNVTQPIVVASEKERNEVEERMSANYRLTTYALRPGVQLILGVREANP